MEGDGPVLGTPRDLGVLIVGRDLPAVDATACRLMELDPRHVPYLALAADRLGPIAERRIAQRSEAWRPLAQKFEILDVPHLAPAAAVRGHRMNSLRRVHDERREEHERWRSLLIDAHRM